ncbi:MAG: SDR family oxidoreductase [Candidatus Methylumidiphilus sp.]
MNEKDEGCDENQVFIVGCGDIGIRVALLEQAAGRKVIALARSETSAHRLAQHGIEPVAGDLDHPGSLLELPSTEVVYYFAPPPSDSDGDPRLASLLAAVDKNALPRKLVYISTSGVYGDCGGEWVDENWPVNPRSDRARRRAAAENRLLEWSRLCGADAVILRVPGIYGPGRLPVERIRRGVPVVREGESPWSNRIHADDLAQACVLAALRGSAGGVYNVSDGNPTTMTDYFFRVADLLGLPRPPSLSMKEARLTLGPGILSFLEESKRLDNRRMLEELGVELRYPMLDCGLPACLVQPADSPLSGSVRHPPPGIGEGNGKL